MIDVPYHHYVPGLWFNIVLCFAMSGILYIMIRGLYRSNLVLNYGFKLQKFQEDFIDEAYREKYDKITIDDTFDAIDDVISSLNTIRPWQEGGFENSMYLSSTLTIEFETLMKEFFAKRDKWY